MRLNFHRIAYEALDVCNAVEMATIDAALVRAGTPPGARALDIGCGNASVSIRMATRFGLAVDAVELEPQMADLARSRIAASPMPDAIHLHEARSDAVLAGQPPFDLIVALGVTEPVGGGVRDPEGMLHGLAGHLPSGGRLLWGDLVWTAEPPTPLRQIVELTNLYADDPGWRAAGAAAGLDLLSADIAPPSLWDAYGAAGVRAVTDWTAAHPDHPDAPALTARARQVGMMFDFGRGMMSFGLYLFGKP